MPFLSLPFIIKNWHTKIKMKTFYGLLVIFSAIIIMFLVPHYIFFSFYKKKIEGNYEKETIKILKHISLKDIITNNILNFIYLFDIELVVFFVQWGFFILYIKHQKIIEFFSHKYWAFIHKFYFSFLLSCNTIILAVFYSSETLVKINAFNLFLYFFIDTVLIFFITVLVYILIELPLKKISKIYLSFNNNISTKALIKKNDKNEDDSDSDSSDNSDINDEEYEKKNN